MKTPKSRARWFACAVVAIAAGFFGWLLARGVDDDAGQRSHDYAQCRPDTVRPDPVGFVNGVTAVVNGPGADDSESIVEGSVVDGADVPVSCGVVKLVAESQIRAPNDCVGPKLAVDPVGRFRFRDVPVGQYAVVVVADSLPPGILAPFDQSCSDRARGPATKGYFAASVDVPSPGTRANVVVRVWKSIQVSGFVVTQSGRAVAGADVRLQAIRPGLESVHYDGRTDESGKYVLSDIAPGLYRAIALSTGDDPACQSLSRPVPIDVAIVDGCGSSVVPNLVLGGRVTVRGRVLDQDDHGYGNGVVIAYVATPVGSNVTPHNWNSELQRAVTAEDGTFTLAEMPDAEVIVQVEPEGYVGGRELAGNRLVDFAPLRRLDLARAGRFVQLGDLRVDVSRPFRVSGRLTRDGAESADSARPCDLVIEVVPRSGFANSRLARGRPAPVSTMVVPKDAGTFAWACETPFPTVELRVRRHGGEVVRVLTFDPVPDTAAEAIVEVGSDHTK